MSVDKSIRISVAKSTQIIIWRGTYFAYWYFDEKKKVLGYLKGIGSKINITYHLLILVQVNAMITLKTTGKGVD